MTRRDNRVTHEPCDVDGPGAEKINVGGDPRPDIVIVRKGGREVCRAMDLNFDGVVDAWVYYDASGRVSRRENDYDRDGKIDEIALYRNGVLVEKRRATAMVGRIDTWHFYKGGRLVRTERDSDGDSIIDQWWEYPKPDRPDCPLIHSDTNGDGRPDPGASVDVCQDSSGYVPPEAAEAKQPESVFDKTEESLPSEVEEKPAPAGDTKKSEPGSPGTTTKKSEPGPAGKHK